MPTLRTWIGNTPYNVTGRLIRDTGTGLIIESSSGVRYFSFNRDVLDTGETEVVQSVSDAQGLFAPLN